MPKKMSVGEDNGPGACMITDPVSGQQVCHFITKAQCDARGGVFVGGLCPPSTMAAVSLKADVAKPKKAAKKTAVKAKKVTVKPKKAAKKKAAPKKKAAVPKKKSRKR